MKTGQPSRTAFAAAFHRAAHQVLEGGRIFFDPLTLREALAPLRVQLSRAPYLGGTAPNYADYIALGAFHWIASVSSLPLLPRGDEALCAWLDRGFDLYGGIGRDPRMKPLVE